MRCGAVRWGWQHTQTDKQTRLPALDRSGFNQSQKQKPTAKQNKREPNTRCVLSVKLMSTCSSATCMLSSARCAAACCRPLAHTVALRFSRYSRGHPKWGSAEGTNLYLSSALTRTPGYSSSRTRAPFSKLYRMIHFLVTHVILPTPLSAEYFASLRCFVPKALTLRFAADDA